MEEERGKIEGFNTFKLSKLVDVVEKEQEAGKYVFLADMTGQAATFFSYQTRFMLYDFHADAKRVIVQKTQTPAEATENFRKHVKLDVASGRMTVVNFETMCPKM